MGVSYALFTLKQKKNFLEEKIIELNNGNFKERHGKLNVDKFITKLKHDISELEFGIEILEGYED